VHIFVKVVTMAFFSKVGGLLKQSVSRHVSLQVSASNPSIYQALRCMSSSKLFVGGIFMLSAAFVVGLLVGTTPDLF